RNLATGQVAEWLVWTRLVASSGGDLHVFLPLDDRGIDGIVHRISTDEYARVQVKGRTQHPRGGIAVQVPAGELADDRTVLVAVDVDLASAAMSEHVLAVNAPAFRELAQRNVTRWGEVLYEAEMMLPPPPHSPWAPWCVTVEELGERLLASAVTPSVAAEPHDWIAARRLGYRAEMELLRRAADSDALNVFKAFPDLEPNEYLLYNTSTREIAGIQVKSVTFPPGLNEAQVSVYRPALRPSPRTWFVVFLEDTAADTFLPDCAVIASIVVGELLAGGDRSNGKLWVTRGVTGRLAPWRVPVTSLGRHLAELAR
ncbi:MAG TPA: hypothetical protein VG520_05095, partial [Candidatus Dormibacteraeota bacterium]|nr:hypothetical protein [Candidatus Dormibacteraeota bacterium]